MSFGMSSTAKRTTLRLAAALMVGAAASAVVAVPAEAQVNNASLRGRITAPEGGMPTQVAAIDQGSGYRRVVQVGADGAYNFPALRAGQYKLEVTTPTGTRSTDVFTLSIGQNAVFDFDLTPAAPAAGETPADVTAGAEGSAGDVIVTGNRIRRLEGGTVGVTITPRLIDQLPQINRNFLAFADLAPGVQFITSGNGDSRIQGGAQASSTVNVFIDGVSQKDYVLKNGITGQDTSQGNPFPQLAIGEYQVLSSNYKAEFDQVSSVAITAGTKSGTNEFHGEGFFDFTNQDLRAARPIEIYPANAPGKIATRDMQFGGALGGPIVKDVLHFFVTYEGKRRRQPSDVIPGANLPITFFPERYRDRFGTFNETFNEDLYFGKINFAPTAKDLFEFSGKYRNESGEDFNGGINAFDTRSTLRVKEVRGTARWEHTEDNWVNDFKVSYEDVSWNPEPIVNGNVTLFQARTPNPGSPGVSRRDDILRFGGGSSFQDKGQKGWTVSDDFTYTGLETHTFKVGVKAKWVKLNTFEQNNTNPVYSYFTPLGAAFNDTLPWRVLFTPEAVGDPRIRSNNFQFGVYAQDDWDVTDRLTLNLGLRWDYERTPAYLNYQHDPAVVALVTGQTLGANGQPLYPNLLNADYDINDYISTGSERKSFKGAWQPRVGFTYKLDDAGRFAIFGGFGRSYDRNQFDFLQQELTQGLFASRIFQFYTNGGAQPDPENVCNPVTSPSTCILYNPIYLTPEGRAQLLAGGGTSGGRETRFIKNDLKMPYSDQFSLGIRGSFGAVDLEAGYNRQQSRDGFVYLLGNRRPDGTFFPPTGTPSSPFSFTPPGFGSIIIGDNGLDTNADIGYFKLVKRYSEASPWSIDATYTFTKAEENRQFGEVFSLEFPNLEAYPFLPSSGVRRHRFVMAGTVDVPLGLSISGKFQIASPLYFKSFLDTDGTPGTRVGQAVESEGNGDRWGYRQMDLSATKYIPIGFINDEARLRVRVDIINLFNDRNYNGFNNITGLRDFNNFATDGLPRTVKLSAGFSF